MRPLLLLLLAGPASSQPISLQLAIGEANGIVFAMKRGDVSRAERSLRELEDAADALRRAYEAVHHDALKHSATQEQMDGLIKAAGVYERAAASAAHDARAVEDCDEEKCGDLDALQDAGEDAVRAHQSLCVEVDGAYVPFLNAGLKGAYEADKLVSRADGDVRRIKDVLDL